MPLPGTLPRSSSAGGDHGRGRRAVGDRGAADAGHGAARRLRPAWCWRWRRRRSVRAVRGPADVSLHRRRSSWPAASSSTGWTGGWRTPSCRCRGSVPGPRRILFAFGAATALISAWISNTATTAMMFAIGLSILAALRSRAEVHHRSALRHRPDADDLVRRFRRRTRHADRHAAQPHRPRLHPIPARRRGHVLPVDADRHPGRSRCCSRSSAIYLNARGPSGVRDDAGGCRADPAGAGAAGAVDGRAALGAHRLRADGRAVGRARVVARADLG